LNHLLKGITNRGVTETIAVKNTRTESTPGVPSSR
jgi:hypothetical protein